MRRQREAGSSRPIQWRRSCRGPAGTRRFPSARCRYRPWPPAPAAQRRSRHRASARTGCHRPSPCCGLQARQWRVQPVRWRPGPCAARWMPSSPTRRAALRRWKRRCGEGRGRSCAPACRMTDRPHSTRARQASRRQDSAFRLRRARHGLRGQSRMSEAIAAWPPPAAVRTWRNGSSERRTRPGRRFLPCPWPTSRPGRLAHRTPRSRRQRCGRRR